MNLDLLQNLWGLDLSEATQIMILFLDTARSNLDDGEQALHENDAKRAAAAAHSLKGAVVSLGLDLLVQTASEPKEMARRSELHPAGSN